jgi:hypothetical protein
LTQALLPADLLGRAIDDAISQYTIVNAAVAGLYVLFPAGSLGYQGANRTIVCAVVLDQWTDPSSAPILSVGSGVAANDWRTAAVVNSPGTTLAVILTFGDAVPIYPSTTTSFSLNLTGTSTGTFRACAWGWQY